LGFEDIFINKRYNMTSKHHTDDVYKEKKIPKNPRQLEITLDENQKEVVEFIRNNKITLLLADPGCGKTTIALHYALTELRKKNIEKVILTKPIIEIGRSMGFLPGTSDDKVEQYLRSFVDNMEKLVGKSETHKLFMEKKVIFEPIQYCRGVTFENCCIIADEIQGATLHEQVSFITRKSTSSKLILMADPFQSDIKNTGIFDLIEILKNEEGIGIKELDESFQKRDELIQRIYKKYKVHLFNK